MGRTMNLPNRITLSRLVLAVVFFGLVSSDRTWMLDAAVAVFAVACLTDFFDGYFARKYALATAFGRVADPFVDKVIVCGGFILLAGRTTAAVPVPVIEPWMVVVLVSREFLVTAIRGHAESIGIAFGAELSGKIKAVIQMVAVGCVAHFLAHGALLGLAPWISKVLTIVLVYLAVIVTVLSAVTYVLKAWRVFRVAGAKLTRNGE